MTFKSRPRYLLRHLLACLVVSLCCGVGTAMADGTLTHLSGPVSVLKADGKTLAGAVGAKVAVGDTVATGPGGYLRMEMTDGGELVLRPDSQLKIESYAFAETKPAGDSFIFSMLKGGLRTVTGLIGKRGNKDAYEGRTATATIGIRGTQYDMRVCLANCGALADGTYLAVRFGAVQASNAQGSLVAAAGQVVHVPPQRPPVILPRDPGIGFTPPPGIPKLDEKKKLQAVALATSPEPSTTGAAGAQPAPHGDQPVSGAAEGSSRTERAELPNSGAGESSTVSPTASPATPGAGTDCSVQ